MLLAVQGQNRGRDMHMLNDYKKSGEFTELQLEEIGKGLDAGLDVDKYADPRLLAIQMQEIRIGLEENLPIEKYANVQFDWYQMKEIRKGLENGLDVDKYADVSIPFDAMRQIRKGLEDGIDLQSVRNLQAGVLRQLRKAIADGIDISKYIKEGYDKEQLQEIRLALKNHVNIEPYLSITHRGISLREIRLGLENQVDVSLYANEEMNWQQMREIRLGLEMGLDVKQYISPFYSWEQMREVRLGLEQGLSVNVYSSLMNTAKEMHNKRMALLGVGTEEDIKEGKWNCGKFTLYLCQDGMEAVVELHQGVKSVDAELIRTALKENGIVYGIHKSAIEAISVGKSEERRVVVAKGTEAHNGADGRFEFFFDTQFKRKPKLLEDGSVDYKHTKCFEYVHKGDKLACYHPAEFGKSGRRVTGHIILPEKGTEHRLMIGNGVIVDNDKRTYIAQIDGKVTLSEDLLEVSDMLVVDEVTQATGNVEFHGAVYVRGNVGEGAKIKAGRDIFVDGFTEGAVLKAGGDIVLRKGCNAADRGGLYAQGDVRAKFLESATVEAQHDIHVNYTLKSHLQAKGIIKISGKFGSIVGGTAKADLGISANQYGNEMGIPTTLIAGQKSDLDEREAQLVKDLTEAKQDLLLLNNAYREFQRKLSVEQRNLNPMYLKVEDAVYTKQKEVNEMNKQRKALNLERNKANRICIVASGFIYPGVDVDINGVKWKADRMRGVTLRAKGAQILAIHS